MWFMNSQLIHVSANIKPRQFGSCGGMGPQCTFFADANTELCGTINNINGSAQNDLHVLLTSCDAHLQQSDSAVVEQIC